VKRRPPPVSLRASPHHPTDPSAVEEVLRVLFTRQQLSEATQFSLSTIDRAVRDKKLAKAGSGRSVRFTVAAVEVWLGLGRK
jgi:predicted DNA-binding transcriptional regulator AlpA